MDACNSPSLTVMPYFFRLSENTSNRISSFMAWRDSFVFDGALGLLAFCRTSCFVNAIEVAFGHFLSVHAQDGVPWGLHERRASR